MTPHTTILGVHIYTVVHIYMYVYMCTYVPTCVHHRHRSTGVNRGTAQHGTVQHGTA